ncbi:hypothetical protein CW745_14040 [Psychromonas sp. psych-6C06]|uniref:hypothetical protein n=1 Tax=Psychromonas sp. psych-6C06 TaxID=2058089 RepID=UPI000C34D677|nr:hypothetical protein [Psychromonas sp. psych-6C06]PKF60647.1 hypothetical protein CW745_14040 [Psychromonas sp. psych-6C06]
MMQKSKEMVSCGTSKVPAWIVSRGIKMIFDRKASVDEDGGISLGQMRDDECVISPNAIYRTERNLTEWQPAETAPKGDVIIAHFSGHPVPVAATWNDPEQQWIFSNVQVSCYEGKWNDTFFDTEYECADALKAWMPLPTINEDK